MSTFDPNFPTPKDTITHIGSVESNPFVSDKAGNVASEEEEEVDPPFSFIGDLDANTKCRPS